MTKLSPWLMVAAALSMVVSATVLAPDTFRAAGRFAATLIFTERVTPETLREKYARDEEVKILIVPGHDGEFWGTDYRGIREADLNLELGKLLKEIFTADPRFTVFITREGTDYAPEFVSYFSEQSSLIREFRDYVRTTFFSAVRKGAVTRVDENFHGTASDAIARRLYGINKWADDRSIDLVLHLHFNDYPRRRRDLPGRYAGWAIYIPESQLPNARASRALTESVAARLHVFGATSTYSQERAGVVEDQELIAVGANASLHAASLLIEYGYIYEPQFVDPAARRELFPRLAELTYQGVVDFFESGIGEKTR